MSTLVLSTPLDQYADDTTLYSSDEPANIHECELHLQLVVDRLSSWSNECNLALNVGKTKVMPLSTTQLARVHNLEYHQVNLVYNSWQGQTPDRVRRLRVSTVQYWTLPEHGLEF